MSKSSTSFFKEIVFRYHVTFLKQQQKTLLSNQRIIQGIIHENNTERIIVYNIVNLSSVPVCIWNQAAFYFILVFLVVLSSKWGKNLINLCYNALFVQIQYNESLIFFNI